MTNTEATIIDKTEALSSSELQTLIAKTDYILTVTIVSQLESDIASFEGGDTWFFAQYQTKTQQQFLPVQTSSSWTNTTLSLPGVKESANSSLQLEVGARYILFYDYSAMANGYSLEGLLRWSEEKSAIIEAAITA